jgi:hypothetical protein
MCWASGNGVSPSLARPGAAWHGRAGLGGARRGVAWVAMAARRAYGSSLPPSLVDKVWQCMASRGSARRGVAWQRAVRSGRARATDGGTEGFGSPCHPHKGGLGSAQRGGARFGLAKLGAPGSGMAWLGMGCRRQHWGLRLPLLLSSEGRRGRTRQGRTRRCGVGLDWAGLGAAGADDLSTGGFGLLCWVSWNPDMARLGRAGTCGAGQGVAWHGMATADDLSTEGASPPCWVHSTHLKA